MTHPPADAPAPKDDVWDIHKPVARRALLLCGAGAVIGLLIAGFGLFTAQGTRTSAIPAEDAAIVNNVPILRSDLIQQISALYSVPFSKATRAQKQKVLEDMIREELYVQRGVEMGLPNDDIDVRQALFTATEGQLAQDAMTARPSEEELQRWYDTHRAKYASEGQMSLHEYLLPAGSAGAERAVAGLRGGASAASLGLKTSGRVDDGEEFYFAAQLHLGDRIFAVARGLRNGQVSDPIVEKDGVHILQMVDNQPPVPAAYPQVRDRVMQDFLADKVARLQEGNKRFLKKRADIKIAADLQ